ncbi:MULTISPECIES: GNAT family N-acetyltransferase [Chromohalobacter]|uniref:GNAT family N-acetyltransferase n=1 Tax=Chromohalobacter TaxID=42054 RepID=UPI0002E96DFE|nr:MULTISPECIES: GNAT family N-acetyltransferase [Chromohalobacter]MBZ5876883.1 GNAT family N-acetyltransferase [Chromohalobacter salexigens]MDF9434290.1 GNAT family N-acetyltransferase [Chromohalobacter israelensis]MDO0946022.1 GNAT family N-acetyltransferase [Chromohalobacter salexigens]PWW42530.1 GNAT family acetyltransferase [Chromohalobacter salexigens]
MIERIVYRAAKPRDAADQAEVFHHAVMQGAAGYYTLAQRDAWAMALPRDAEAWAARQVLYPTLVAICDGRCVGFCELDPEAGRIETLYVWPSLARRGVGKSLLEYAEGEMRQRGVTCLRIEASLVLADALVRRDWRHDGEDWVERAGERIPRVRLSKALQAL